MLTFLVTNQSVRDRQRRTRSRSGAQATSATISRALLANLATLPVTSSSGAFVYRLNPELGTVERATQSFGPFFIERALTAGRGQASFGMTFQHLHFTSLDGRSLRDGSLVTTANQFTDETTPFDVDQLTLNIDASVATLYGNVGVTDRLEVGVAAPFVALTLDGSRINTYRGRTFTQATASARAVGLADLVVRTKYTLFAEDGVGRWPRSSTCGCRRAGRRICSAPAPPSRQVLRDRIARTADALSAHANAGVSVRRPRERDRLWRRRRARGDRAACRSIGELLGRWIDSPGHIVPVAAPHIRG